MVLAAESPRPFSFHAPVCPALAQPQLAVRLLADRQVDHKRLALALVHPALRPELHLHRQAAWLEVYWQQAAHALFRLAPRRDLQHHSAACQVGRSPVVPALGRRDAHAHLDRRVVASRCAQFRKLYRALALGRLRDHRSA